MLDGAHMATLTIRNLDEALKSTLRVRAAGHGHSMEEEVRSILRQALSKPIPDRGLGQRLAGRFQAVATELPMPARSLPRPAPQWDEPA
ncbi:MAG: plasmid stabilization protein [Burkholderiales bacterium]|nr:plasmid stabilization protein [Burkholderiales bacterium]